MKRRDAPRIELACGDFGLRPWGICFPQSNGHHLPDDGVDLPADGLDLPAGIAVITQSTQTADNAGDDANVPVQTVPVSVTEQ